MPRTCNRTYSGAALAAVLSSAPFMGTTIASAEEAALSPPGEAAAGKPNWLEEIVVTAEKRSVNIQEVPASVSAIAGDTLELLGLKSLQDYSKYVPGLLINQNGSPGQTTVTLRGIAPIGPGSVVGYYVDDAPLGSSGNFARATAFALDLLPYDLERFEVLRGPQGTLYGAGSMGGLIKYVLRQADPNHFSTKVGVEASSINHGDGVGHAARAAVNLPIVDQQLAIRLSGFDQKDPGYVDNARLHLEDINDVHQYGGRAALTWLPADNVKVNLNAMLYRLQSDDNNRVRFGNVTPHQDGGGATIFSGTPTLGDFSQAFAYRQPFTKNIDYFSGSLNWDFAAVSAVAATSYSKTRTRDVTDQTENYGAYTQLFGLPPGVSRFDELLTLDKFTQEFRLVSPTGGTFEWLAGVFYTHEKSDIHQLVDVRDANYQSIGGPIRSVFDPYFAFAQLPSTYDEYAGFGDVTLNVSPKFDITAGLRWARNEQDFHQISDGVAIGGFVDKPGESAESVATWQLNARYRFDPNVMAYARVATGYRPGGPNPTIGGKTFAPVDSDTLVSYELGLKSTFLDGRALLNVTLFDIEWEKIQLTVRDAATSTSNFANAGDAYSRGVEIEGSIVPNDGLRIGYDATYTKAKLTKLIPGSTAFILGYQLPGVPEWSAGLTADYQWSAFDDWRASVGGGFRYIGEQWVAGLRSDVANTNTENPAYTTLDLRTSLSNGRYDVTLFVRNVTDKRVYLQSVPVANPLVNPPPPPYALDAVVLQPRTIGLSLDVSF
jgi:iron complex outermembrane receptor protein